MAADAPVYGVFSSREAARRATGGQIYKVHGQAEDEAIILRDSQGRLFLYVSPGNPKYRDLVASAHGGRLSEDGYDADHVASRGIEAKFGQGYVLMGRVDRGANRSAGRVEKPGRHLDRDFNQASFGEAKPVSHRQMQKTANLRMAQYPDLRAGERGAGIDDPDVRYSLLQDDATQARLEAMIEREIPREPTVSPSMADELRRARPESPSTPPRTPLPRGPGRSR